MKIELVISHLAAAVVTTVLIMVIYISVQQNYRMDANDPQVAIANNIGTCLDNGESVQPYLAKTDVDIKNDLSPFVCLLDAKGQVVNSTATLDGHLIHLPSGLFDHVNKNGEEQVTWQPRKDVRIALVVNKVHANNIAFVAVGRSLKETELRVSNLGWICLIGWIICIGMLVIHFLIIQY
jgi:hypothetical protein